MNIPDYAISISIAILYPLFFHKTVDVFMNKNKIDKLCGNDSIVFMKEQTEEDVKCFEEKRLKLKNYNTKRFMTLMCAGILAIILSYVLKQPALVLGFGLSGVFTILNATYGYWNDMDDKVKMSMIGFTLVILITSPVLFKKYINVLQNKI